MTNIDSITANFEALVNRIYQADGKYNPTNLDNDLYNFVNDNLLKGLQSGFGQSFDKVDYRTPDGQMLKHLRNNVYYFSAAKNYQQLTAINEALRNEAGELVSFSDFKKAALNIHTEFNVNWLSSEYNHAVANGQMASKWIAIQEDKAAYPFLRYETAGDARVRPDHQSMNGITKPVDDPFWNTHYPPNDWGCRCSVTQVRTGAKVTDTSKMKLPLNPPLFNNNAAKEGVVYPKDHPYFDIVPKDKKVLAEYVQQQLLKAVKPEDFRKYNNSIAIHPLHGKNELKENLNTAKVLAAYDKQIKLLPKYENKTSPDASVDGKVFEFKTWQTNTLSSLDNHLRKSNKQASRIVIHAIGDLSKTILIKSLYKRIHRTQLETIWIIWKEDLHQFTRKQILNGIFKKAFK